MLALTVVAVVAAVAAWLRPMPEAGSGSGGPVASFSDQQVADAKARVCAAWERVHRAVMTNSTRTAGDDPNLQLLVGVNDRQVYVVGSAYLLTTLSDEPATPPALTKLVTNLAKIYQVATLNLLASDNSDSERAAANETASNIRSFCE